MQEEHFRQFVEVLGRTASEAGRFLILWDADDEGRFVQFKSESRRDDGGEFDHADAVLWLDLPCKAMNREQNEAAAKWFGTRGVSSPTEEKHKARIGEKDRVCFTATWHACIGADAEKAAREALDLFEAVWGQPKRGLSLAEDSFD